MLLEVWTGTSIQEEVNGVLRGSRLRRNDPDVALSDYLGVGDNRQRFILF
jgi:hypothetical protein